MNFDANLKRLFPLVVCIAIASIAYFQASGIGEMVASSISDAPASEPVEVRAPTVRTEPKSAQPILKRNAFDSVTGPLDGTAPRAESPTPEPEAEGEPEDGDPKCSFGRVGLIMTAEDPTWSFASIAGNDGESKLRRIGDTVDDHTVDAVGWDRVWLVKGSERCQIAVQDRERNQKKAAKKPAKAKVGRRRSTGAPKLPDELANKIHKVSDTEFNIERSVVDDILEKQAELMRYTRMRPVKEGDKVVGLRMSRIRSGTLLDTLGLKNGDQIKSINGFELTDPQKALEAYGRLRTANKLTLQVGRGGAATTIEYNIQ